jgi:hypothetical protein
MVPAAPPIEQLSESARRLLRRGLEISACELFFILPNVDYGIGRPVVAGIFSSRHHWVRCLSPRYPWWRGRVPGQGLS